MTQTIKQMTVKDWVPFIMGVVALSTVVAGWVTIPSRIDTLEAEMKELHKNESVVYGAERIKVLRRDFEEHKDAMHNQNRAMWQRIGGMNHE